MINAQTINAELNFLAAQSQTGPPVKIQKLTPVQMAALAATLGRRHKIQIEFGNYDTAATDGKTIVMPLTSKENSWLVRGFLDHELAHVRLTDFSLIPKNEPFRKSLWNVLEDIRIEAAMPMLYPGMKTNYRILIRELCRTSPEAFKIDKDSSPDNIIIAYILLMLRTLYLRQGLAKNALKARKVFIKTFGKDLETGLFPVIMKISNAKRPHDVLDLVDQVIALLKQHAAEPQQNKNDMGDDVPGDVFDKPDGDDQSTGTQDNPNTGNQDGTDNAQVQTGSDTNTSSRAAIKDALDSATEISDLGDQLRRLADTREYQNNKCSGQYGIATPISSDRLRKKGYELQAVNTSSALVANLSARLQGLLQAHDLQNAKPGMSGSRINRNRLHRIKTGDPKLFLKKTPKKIVNTAVHLLIDNSASMDANYRFITTRNVVLALAKTLGSVRGVNLAMTVFPAFFPYPERGGRGVVPVAPTLSHGQVLQSKILYPAEALGMTPLAAAVRWTGSSMINLTEPKKILVIITDGEPDNPAQAKAAIDEVVALNIEVVCLGIETLVSPDTFPKSEIINNVKELPEKMFRLFERLLLTKK